MRSSPDTTVSGPPEHWGWETIKASIVRVDDVQAVRIINDSNLQRTGVTELKAQGLPPAV